MRYVWATASHQGRVRGRNEDAVYPESSGSSDQAILVGVADGMGGAIAGNVASTTALGAATDEDPSAETSIVERVVTGNDQLLRKIARDPDLRGMGTTMTLGLFQPEGTLEVGHVGDSRAYLVAGSGVQRLTLDHSWVEEEIRAGRLQPEDPAAELNRHIITRSIGGEAQVETDVYGPIALPDPSVLLLCTDGLHGVLEDAEIAKVVSQSKRNYVADLVRAVLKGGAPDNVAVALLRHAPSTEGKR